MSAAESDGSLYTGYVECHGESIFQSFEQMLFTVKHDRDIPFVLSDAFLTHTIQLCEWYPTLFDDYGMRDSLPLSHREFQEYQTDPNWQSSGERRTVVAERLRGWLSAGMVFLEEDARMARAADFLERLTPNLASWEDRRHAQELAWRFSPGFLEAHDVCVVRFDSASAGKA